MANHITPEPERFPSPVPMLAPAADRPSSLLADEPEPAAAASLHGSGTSAGSRGVIGGVALGSSPSFFSSLIAKKRSTLSLLNLNMTRQHRSHSVQSLPTGPFAEALRGDGSVLATGSRGDDDDDGLEEVHDGPTDPDNPYHRSTEGAEEEEELDEEAFAGQISLTLTTPCRLRLLRVRFSGIINTRFSRSAKTTIAPSATSNAIIFKDLLTLLGSTAVDDPPVVLEPGPHVFPFTFRVPIASLPSSFTGNYGEIRYEITGILVRIGASVKSCSHVISIPSTVDAGGERYARPAETVVKIPAGFWVWRTGHIEARLSLIGREAFSSEEVAQLRLDVLNHSAAGVVIRDIYMKQCVLYRTGNEVRGPNVERVHRLRFEECFSSMTRRIRRVVHFPVPASNTFSPSLRTSLIEVTHFLCVRVAPKFNRTVGKGCVVEVPVTIAGFPSTFNEMGGGGEGRVSVETLPIYERGNGAGMGTAKHEQQEQGEWVLREEEITVSVAAAEGRMFEVGGAVEDDEDDVELYRGASGSLPPPMRPIMDLLETGRPTSLIPDDDGDPNFEDVYDVDADVVEPVVEPIAEDEVALGVLRNVVMDKNLALDRDSSVVA
ncbi:Arrestin domain-containing protein 4 [Irineochytrium annulatum]|nr:Arrestin domain-containing protein 4 [Irineochytrium annulatum]